MNVLIVCVNYNSYDKLKEYLDSIVIASREFVEIHSITVKVADNSSNRREMNSFYDSYVKCEFIQFSNLGYFGAAQKILNNVGNISFYDYTIVSNVDVLLDPSFFVNLSKLERDNSVAWIAPSILSLANNCDKNPSVLERYPLWKLLLLLLTYNSFFYPLYNRIYSRYLKNKVVSAHDEYIYAGHGSFFIFSNIFFKQVCKLEYPIFLYGEELYIAEIIRELGLRVKYCPTIVVRDYEHISTSLINRKKYYKYNRQALKYILTRYY